MGRRMSGPPRRCSAARQSGIQDDKENVGIGGPSRAVGLPGTPTKSTSHRKSRAGTSDIGLGLLKANSPHPLRVVPMQVDDPDNDPPQQPPQEQAPSDEPHKPEEVIRVALKTCPAQVRGEALQKLAAQVRVDSTPAVLCSRSRRKRAPSREAI
jgi:hypothetical protein